MTKNEERQYAKNTALNAIRKIHNPKYKGYSRSYFDSDESVQEERDSDVSYIIERLEKDLLTIKEKHRENNSIN